jgi:hypothetical protein
MVEKRTERFLTKKEVFIAKDGSGMVKDSMRMRQMP